MLLLNRYMYWTNETQAFRDFVNIALHVNSISFVTSEKMQKETACCKCALVVTEQLPSMILMQ